MLRTNRRATAEIATFIWQTNIGYFKRRGGDGEVAFFSVMPFSDERTLFAHWLLRQIYVNLHLMECLFASRLFIYFTFGMPFVERGLFQCSVRFYLVWLSMLRRRQQHFSSSRDSWTYFFSSVLVTKCDVPIYLCFCHTLKRTSPSFGRCRFLFVGNSFLSFGWLCGAARTVAWMNGWVKGAGARSDRKRCKSMGSSAHCGCSLAVPPTRPPSPGAACAICDDKTKSASQCKPISSFFAIHNLRLVLQFGAGFFRFFARHYTGLFLFIVAVGS